MIEVKNLTKKIGQKVVFENCSFDFDNKIYQITGMNGIGKSVLLRLLAGIDKKYDGSINWKNDGDVLFLDDNGIGVPFLTIEENILLAADILGYKIKTEKLIGSQLFINDSELLNQNYEKSSLGNRCKVGLSMLWLPIKWKLIILDEAMNGVDENSRKLIYSRLEQIHNEQEGTVVIIVSHTEAITQFLPEDVVFKVSFNLLMNGER